MKRRRPHLQLSDRQQLFLALAIVLLLAISVLYCLGFASLTLRSNLENTSLPWSATDAAPHDTGQSFESAPSGPTDVLPSP